MQIFYKVKMKSINLKMEQDGAFVKGYFWL